MPDEPIRLLFVCVENACRSQMAAAFAGLHGGAGFEAFSAGSRPAAAVNPKAIEAMREAGCDISRERPKSLAEVPADGYDAVVTMGCGDACPFVAARQHIEWNIPDPKHMPPDEFRAVRDSLGENVKTLIARLRAARC